MIVFGTTNRPWDLDEAIRRRFEKRIYIPLPDAEARRELLSITMPGLGHYDDKAETAADAERVHDDDFNELIDRLEGYSGADIVVVCREAGMRPLRRLLSMMSVQAVQRGVQSGDIVIPSASIADVLSALESTKPSVDASQLARYAQWESTHGSK